MCGGSLQAVWALDHFLAHGHKVRLIYLAQNHLLERKPYTKEQLESDRAELLRRGVVEARLIEDAYYPPLPASTRNPFRRVINSLTYRTKVARKKRDIARRICAAINETPGDVCLFYLEMLEYFLFPINKKSVAWLWGGPHEKLKLDMGIKRMFGSTTLAQLVYPLSNWWVDTKKRRVAKKVDRGFTAPLFAVLEWQKRLGQNPKVDCVPFSMDDIGRHLKGHDPLEPLPAEPPYQIVMYGHLNGVLGLSGMLYFIDEILPEIVRQGLADHFHFIHAGDPTSYAFCEAKIHKSGIEFLGFLPDEKFADTLNRCHAILNPIPVYPGAGSRLTTACATASCIVSHTSIEAGFPEFRNGHNCLTAKTPSEFVDVLLTVCEDRSLNRRLRRAARKTYDDHFRPENGLEATVRIMEAVANQ